MTRRLEGRARWLEIIVSQSELHDGAHRLQFEGNPRWPFAAMPFADLHPKGVGKQPRPLRLEHFTLPVDPAVFSDVPHRRADIPVGLNSPSTPVSLGECTIRQRFPQSLG